MLAIPMLRPICGAPIQVHGLSDAQLDASKLEQTMNTTMTPQISSTNPFAETANSNRTVQNDQMRMPPSPRPSMVRAEYMNICVYVFAWNLSCMLALSGRGKRRRRRLAAAARAGARRVGGRGRMGGEGRSKARSCVSPVLIAGSQRCWAMPVFGCCFRASVATSQRPSGGITTLREQPKEGDTAKLVEDETDA